MSRIEESPDDLNESLNDGPSPTTVPSLEGLMSQESLRLNSQDASTKVPTETLEDWSKTPLFMNRLDVAEAADGENAMLEAIRALQYEGTKSEVVRNFKDQGNEMVKAKKWTDAKEFYSKGIAVLIDTSNKYEKSDDIKAEQWEQRLLEEVLYANRAQCNLELKNYRATTLDCAAALKINPKNIKAHYRSARALLALDRVAEAEDVCSRGLQLESANKAFKATFDDIQTRAGILADKEAKSKAEQMRKNREQLTIKAALKARNIRLRGSAKPPDLEDATIRLSPDPLSPKSLLEFPTLFLYPVHNQSDFIKAFAEKDSILDHLSYLLPAPWDAGKEYAIEGVRCYMDSVSGGMVQVGKKLSLFQALTGGNSEIVDGLVKIYVVPTALSSKWVEEMKQKRSQ